MVEVKAPRVDDRRQGERYSSAILPAYMRTSPKVTEVLPIWPSPAKPDNRHAAS
jgi:putative transposase